MIFDKLKSKIIKAIGLSDKKEWLDNLVENAEKIRDNKTNVPFKILEIKGNGFQVKVSGLYAYAPFVNINQKLRQISIEKYTTYEQQWTKKSFIKNDKYVYKTRNYS